MKNKTILAVGIYLSFGAVSTVAIADENKAPQQTLYQAKDLPSFEGGEKFFTGKVTVQPAFPANDVAHYGGAYITFEAGAHTAWHSHPAGQHMIVTNGTALTGTRDGHVIKFVTGESVWCPPDVDHWHGATPDAPMTHFVVTAAKEGKNVIWKEKLTPEEYHLPK